MVTKKKQEVEYLYWSIGILLGMLGGIVGNFFVSSFFIAYEKFNCTWKSIFIPQTLICIVSFIILIMLYVKFKTKINKISTEHIKEINQNKLDKELTEGRLKSALLLFKKDLSLHFNFSRALYIVLRKRDNPMILVEEYMRLVEIDDQEYTTFEDYEIYEKDPKNYTFLLRTGVSHKQDSLLKNIIIARTFFTNSYKQPYDQEFFKLFGDNVVSSMNPFWYLEDSLEDNILDYLLYLIFFKELQCDFSLYFFQDENNNNINFNKQIDHIVELIDLLDKNKFILMDLKQTIPALKAKILKQKIF